jgi:hypothetical protein
MYNVNDAIVSGTRYKNLFSNQDEKWHSTFIRPIKNLYSMSKVQDVEHQVDITIELFLDKLRERFVCPGKPCEMSEYINFCTNFCNPSLLNDTNNVKLVAWDAMSQVTFSKDLGILEAGCDYKGFLGRSTKTLDYFASVHSIFFNSSSIP